MDFGKRSLNYYTELSDEETLRQLDSSLDGLSNEQAWKRIQLYGKNVISEEKKTHWAVKFLYNFKNPLVLILLFAAGISQVIGETVNAAIITIIVMLSAVLNFFQEYHASKAAEKLKEKVSSQVMVLRSGLKQLIKSSHLTIGDIIQLSAGNLVPADARILSSKDFFVNQSSLTGEAYPAEKTADVMKSTMQNLSDLSNIIFSGSTVLTGSATAVVFKTGANTEFGHIANDLGSAEDESNFVKGIKNFSYMIMQITFCFVVFIFFFNTVFKHTSLFESFTFAIAVAVGLTPELLPMIMSITMGRGSVNMAKKGVIVKRLNSIPNLGSMDILCTDKTGTLTQAQIELVKYMDIHACESEKVLLFAYLNSEFQTGIKNAMDEAVLNYKKLSNHGYLKIDEIPFDFERKRMSVVVEKNGKHFLITKGAPEEIFQVSSHYIKNSTLKLLDAETKQTITHVYHSLSEEGFRVLALSIKPIKVNQKVYSAHDEHNMEILGFVAFLDPPKKEVKQVIHHIESMGIEIKVITGDNELVTKKICMEVDLVVKGVILGSEIENLSDEALKILAEKTTIFARFSPQQKNRVIHALRANNHVVGYMGDGINDAPSLKAADVGISVENAVDVAKESADMILTHKSLRELREGILEGRKTFGNTMKYIMMGISSNFGNMFSVLGAVIFLPFLPMLPIQILLNNLLYDIAQITIPTDNVDAEYIQKPKKWNIQFIKKFMFVFGPMSSIFDFITFYILFSVSQTSPRIFQTGWFLESLATQTLVIYVIRTRKIPFIQSMPSLSLLISTLLMISVAWILPFTKVGHLFGFTILSLNLLGILGVVVILYLLSTEAVKRVFYKTILHDEL